eukprot:1996430-Prymnesium_polylepis.1
MGPDPIGVGIGHHYCWGPAKRGACRTERARGACHRELKVIGRYVIYASCARTALQIHHGAGEARRQPDGCIRAHTCRKRPQQERGCAHISQSIVNANYFCQARGVRATHQQKKAESKLSRVDKRARHYGETCTFRFDLTDLLFRRGRFIQPWATETALDDSRDSDVQIGPEGHGRNEKNRKGRVTPFSASRERPYRRSYKGYVPQVVDTPTLEPASRHRRGRVGVLRGRHRATTY